MPPGSFHIDQNYNSDRDTLFEIFENNNLYTGVIATDVPHDIGDGDITVGFGYDLNKQTYAQISTFLLHALGYDGANPPATPANVSQALTAISTWKGGGALPSAATLAALALTKQQAQTLLDEYLDGYGVYTGLETSLTNNLAVTIPQSRERIVLLDALYRGTFGPNLRTDLASIDANDARTNAWYEIRYNSNGDRNVAAVRGGLAARAYLEGQIFDLYDATVDPSGTGSPDLSSVSKTEGDGNAAAAYRVFTLHKSSMLTYDRQFNPYITTKTALGQTATTLDVSLFSAWDYLASKYGVGFNIGEENIWAAPTTFSNPLGTALLSWSDDSTSRGDYLVIGGEGGFSGSLFSSPVPQSAGALVLVGDNGTATDDLTQLGSLDQALWNNAAFTNGLFEASFLAATPDPTTQNLTVDLAHNVFAVGGGGFPALESAVNSATGSSPLAFSFTFGGSTSSNAIGSSSSWQISANGALGLQIKFNASAALTLVGGGSSGIVVENNLTNIPSLPDIAPKANSIILGASSGSNTVADAALSGSFILVAQGDNNTLTANHAGDVLVGDGNHNTFQDKSSADTSGSSESGVSDLVVMLGGELDGIASSEDTFVQNPMSSTNMASSTDIMIGSSGSNTFQLDPQATGNVIIWGDGGNSTYDFGGTNLNQGKYTVVLLNIKDPTLQKIYDIDPIDILKIYAKQTGAITYRDPSQFKNVVVIVNPSVTDTLKYAGKSISNLQSNSPIGPDGVPTLKLGGVSLGYLDYEHSERISGNDQANPYQGYQNTVFIAGYASDGYDSRLSISNLQSGDFGLVGGAGSSVASSSSPTPSAVFGSGQDTIVAGTGFEASTGDILVGQGGNVTYSVGATDGSVTIDNNVGIDTNNTVLAFNSTIASGQVTVIGSSDGFTLADTVAGTSILIQNASQTPAADISAVTFSDGTVWTEAQLVAMADVASATNTALYGDAGANVLDSQGIATFEQGNGGGDTLVYNQGYGALEINEIEPGTATNVLAFGSGIATSDLAVSGDAAGDLILTDGTTGDRIQLDGMLTNPSAGAQLASFADGTSLTAQQLIALELQPSPGHTSLYGTSGADVIDSRGIATYEQGNGGGDTFIYNQGYGALTVNETEPGAAVDSISFGAGIAPSQLQASGGANGALILTDGTSGDTITLTGMLTNPQQGVQQVTFSDGTVLTAAQLITAAMQPRVGNTTIYGTPGPDTLDSQGIATYEDGEGGGDTFVYKTGYGPLEINEQDQSSATNVLAFGAGIDLSQLQVTGDANGDLILRDGTPGDRIQLDGMLSGSPTDGVQEVTFNDGTSLTAAQLITAEMQPSAGNTLIYGTPGPDTLDSEGVATYENGGGGGDTFIYDQGYGQLEIDESDAGDNPSNTLQFGAGITESQLTITDDSAGNVYLSDGVAGDRIKLDNELSGSPYGVQTVQFADGSTLSQAQLIQLASQTADIIEGTTGADTLVGTPNADIIDGMGAPAGSQDYVIGDGGGDTFIFNPGYGQLLVNEVDVGSAPNNTLQLGSGITASGLTITGDLSGDVLLTDDVPGDTVTLADEMEGSFYGVQQVQFADGSTLSKAQLIQLATTIGGTPNADTLTGTSYGDTFDGKGAPIGSQDYEHGEGSGDTFIYDQGYGNLEINELDRSGIDNTLQLGTGITAADLTVTSDSSGNIFLADGTPGDQIELDGELNGSFHGVQIVSFTDGSTLSQAQLVQLADQNGNSNPGIIDGTTGADTLEATSAAQTFDGKGAPSGSEDYEQGDGGGDTFIYDQGYGHLEIYELDPSGANNTLQFGTGITAADLTVSSDSAGNVYLGDGIAGDQVELDGELNGSSHGVQIVSFADGSTLSQAQLSQLADQNGNSNSNVIDGTTGADTLDGTSAADTFDGKGAPAGSEDYEQGDGGGDTFIYNQGYGSLDINESGSGPNRLQLGAGITPSQVSGYGQGSDFFLLDCVSGDSIRIENQLDGAGQGIDAIQFADGTLWGRAQLSLLATTGSFSGEYLYGTSGPDIFDSKGLATNEIGYGGGDTFIYNQGYGSLTINESGSGPNTLQLGAGIIPFQMSGYGQGSDFFLLDGVSGDSIRIDNQLDGVGQGVDTVQFADGTIWGRAQLSLLATTGSFSGEYLYGTSGPDIFDSKGLATNEIGYGGGDTFIYNQGYGRLQINESGSGNNVLRLGPGITPSSVIVTGDENNIYIADGIAGDSVTIDDMLDGGRVNSNSVGLEFADGTVWTTQQVIDAATTGGPSNTTLYGTSGPDTFDSRGYATYERGYGGGDTFIYNQGYGSLEISESGSGPNTLHLGSGIGASQLEVSADSSGNVYLTDGMAGDEVKLDGELNGANYGVQSVEFSDGSVLSQAQLTTLASGGTGSTTPTLERGEGQATIAAVLAPTTIAVAAGIAASDVILQADNAGDLTLALADDPADSLTITGDLTASTYYGRSNVTSTVSTLTLDDGSTINLEQDTGFSPTALQFTWIGTASDATLTGSNLGSNTFQFGAGGDTITGGDGENNGVNTYLFDKGDGQATVLSGGTGLVQLGADISVSDVILQANNAGDLTIALKDDPADSLTIKGDLTASTFYGRSNVTSAVSTVTPGDGSPLNLEQDTGFYTTPLQFTWIGTASNATLTGSNFGSNLFQLGAGGDTITGSDGENNGVNTYLFDKGDGQATVLSGGSGLVQLGAGIAASDVILQADNSGDLTIALKDDPADSLTIDGDLTTSTYYGRPNVTSSVSTVTLADGSTINLDQSTGFYPTPLQFTWIGTTSNTTLTGSNLGSNVFQLGAGSDTITGGDGENNGVNTYLFDKGDGQATLLAGGTGLVQLGTDITASDVILQANNAGDLTIALKDDPADSLTIKGDLTASTYYGRSNVTSMVSTVTFGDGSSINLEQSTGFSPTPLQFTWIGTASNTTLTGSNFGSNTFQLGAGGDGVVGGDGENNGVNTYLYSKGDGQAAILYGGDGTIQFAAGIANFATQFIFTSGGDLIVTFTDDSADTLDVTSGAFADLQSIQFSDGTSLTHSQIVTKAHDSDNANKVIGTPEADRLIGSSPGDIYDGRGAPIGTEDYEQGQGGGDTFVYFPGYGQLEISETDFSGQPDTLEIGGNLTALQLTVRGDSSGNIYLTDGTPGDQIELDQELGAYYEGIKTVLFTDGSTLTKAELIALASIKTGTTGADSLYGSGAADTFDGLGAPVGTQDYEQGGGGGDTFIYNPGYGQLEISETDFSGSADILKIGGGLTASQIVVTGDSSGNVYLTDGISGDLIKLDQELGAYYNGVQSVAFSDGTSLTKAQLTELAGVKTGTTSADSLYGSSAADTFDGQGAPAGSQDYEQGNDGGDTFIFNSGYGHLEINDTDFSGAPNVLKLGGGISAAQLTVTDDSSGNLFVGDGIAGDRIEIDNGTGPYYAGIQTVQFADGSILGKANLIALATQGTTGPDNLYGTNGPDTFDDHGAPAGSQDYEQGNGGGDTFIYDQGYGQLEINESDYSSNPNNMLQFGAGLTASQISATGDSSGNVTLTDGNAGDIIKLDGALGSLRNGVQTLQFIDGSSLTQQQVNNLADTASPINQMLYGFGSGGSDTFTYNSGAGSVEINETDYSSSHMNILQFGNGISAGQLVATSDSAGNVYLSDGVAGDQIKLDQQLNSSGYFGVDKLQFTDGSSLTRSQIAGMLPHS